MNLLSEAGVTLTGDQNQADVVVINTCGFLEPAKNESLSTIDEFVQLKKAQALKGVVVAGCMTERYLDLMSKKYPEVDAFLQTKNFSDIVQVVSQIEAGESRLLARRRTLVGEAAQLSGHSELPDRMLRAAGKRSFAYVKISEGCNRTCSFCIIPKLRGKLHSRSIEGIRLEVEQLAAMGVKEVVLIAQDLTSYGRDLSDGTSLLALLRELETVEGVEWIRLQYNYPRFFTDELIFFLATSKKFARYLDIPFQHISDSVLARMRRPESSIEIKTLIAKLREAMPDISLRTTLMVGFPGETDLDFGLLLDFVKETQFDHLGTFPYFREEGTPSYDLKDQIAESTKTDRVDKIMRAQKKIQKQKLHNKVGDVLQVMIDGFTETTKQGKVYRGRHRGQAPDIDGMTYVVSDQVLEVGQIIPVAIGKILGDYDLLGSPESEVARVDGILKKTLK